jgi:DNA polymerase-3 subunit delta'
MLISHAPGRLLPTIRSRSQRLDLKPLDEPSLNAALTQMLPDLDGDDRASLLQLSEGSLGLALRLSGDEGLKLARDAETLLAARGAPDSAGVLALADRLGRGADGLRHFGIFLAQAISRRIRLRAQEGRSDERAVELWEQVNALFDRAIGLHMEPRQTILSSARDIASAKRQGAL